MRGREIECSFKALFYFLVTQGRLAPCLKLEQFPLEISLTHDALWCAGIDVVLCLGHLTCPECKNLLLGLRRGRLFLAQVRHLSSVALGAECLTVHPTPAALKCWKCWMVVVSPVNGVAYCPSGWQNHSC